MIDDDFHPDQRQLQTLLQLFVHETMAPEIVDIEVKTLLEPLGWIAGDNFPEWFVELRELGLIWDSTQSRWQNKYKVKSIYTHITPAGSYYIISRPSLLSDQMYGALFDLDGFGIDYAFAVHSYMAPTNNVAIPSSDRFVNINHNSSQFNDVQTSFDLVKEALISDNQIGADFPDAKDRMLDELGAIRGLLESAVADKGRLAMMGWGIFGYLMTHFADRPVGQLAEAAWNALKNLIGI